MTELKTLRDIENKEFVSEHDLGYIQAKEDLKAEAVKWVKFIDNGMKSPDDLWEELTGNKIIYDKKVRKVLSFFIKYFFNINEEDS